MPLDEVRLIGARAQYSSSAIVIACSTSPARHQPRGAGGEERAEKFSAHGLDHLAGHDLVVDSVEVAVVAREDLHAIREAGSMHPGERQITLGARDRRRGHPAPVARGGVEGQRAPAAPDLEQVIARGQLELATQEIQLARVLACSSVSPGSKIADE